eukprot:TRINITY_DN14906_c0_g3_i1.p1 TRINITY_DN14906_c0_g3~~TRINITY_DN14906_c0_g3_i1.p1  ORF type:complete len:135 (+),score=16.46 TRINITY_DN14906_c0_g3_i1:596-1000(+)
MLELKTSYAKHDETLMKQIEDFSWGTQTFGVQTLLLSSKECAIENELESKAEILAFEETEDSSIKFPLNIIRAIQNCIDKANLRMKDIDCFEIDETFSATPILLHKTRGIDMLKINMHGGTYALRDPIGYAISS